MIILGRFHCSRLSNSVWSDWHLFYIFRPLIQTHSTTQTHPHTHAHLKLSNFGPHIEHFCQIFSCFVYNWFYRFGPINSPCNFGPYTELTYWFWTLFGPSKESSCQKSQIDHLTLGPKLRRTFNHRDQIWYSHWFVLSF